jgi:hypothetical protein
MPPYPNSTVSAVKHITRQNAHEGGQQHKPTIQRNTACRVAFVLQIPVNPPLSLLKPESTDLTAG